jgi:hypothetical protein
MISKDSLIEENTILRKKLALAEIWMRREISSQKQKIGEKRITES